jgi:mono/diheme cytochrome c family protein
MSAPPSLIEPRRRNARSCPQPVSECLGIYDRADGRNPSLNQAILSNEHCAGEHGMVCTVRTGGQNAGAGMMRSLRFCLLLPAILLAPAALAADADNGKRLAQARCVPCHAIEPDQHRQVADAPPFEVIARKFGLNPEMLAFSLLDPHPRMNLTLTRREAQDIAAYISTLAK